MAIGSIAALFFFLTILPSLAHAQLAITEIMYDVSGGDTGREWIEVQNVGTEPIALTEWKLFEANSNHGLTTEGTDSLGAGQFAVIADDVAKFRVDWPNYTGLVVNSSFSLNNTGESLALRCCGKDATDRDAVSYSNELGAAGDGNSLHRSGTSWTVGAPSPGSGSILAPVPESSAPEQGSTSEQDPPTVAKKSAGAISVNAGGDRTVLAKSAVPLHVKALTAKKESIEHADFSWNFGDGRAGTGKALSHAWGYAGRYHVSVRVTYEGETATDTFVVEVVPADFTVTRFEDGSVGIMNRSTRDADVSRWRVHDAGKNFVIPDGTVVLKGAQLRIAPETLGFMSTRASLHYPDGTLYAEGEVARTETGPDVVAQVSVPMQQLIVAVPKKEIPRKVVEQEEEAVERPEKRESMERKEDSPEAITPSSTPTQVSHAAAASLVSGAWYWWAGALMISLVGAAGMYAATARVKKSEDEWEIEDDSDEVELRDG